MYITIYIFIYVYYYIYILLYIYIQTLMLQIHHGPSFQDGTIAQEWRMTDLPSVSAWKLDFMWVKQQWTSYFWIYYDIFIFGGWFMIILPTSIWFSVVQCFFVEIMKVNWQSLDSSSLLEISPMVSPCRPERLCWTHMNQRYSHMCMKHIFPLYKYDHLKLYVYQPTMYKMI